MTLLAGLVGFLVELGSTPVTLDVSFRSLAAVPFVLLPGYTAGDGPRSRPSTSVAAYLAGRDVHGTRATIAATCPTDARVDLICKLLSSGTARSVCQAIELAGLLAPAG